MSTTNETSAPTTSAGRSPSRAGSAGEPRAGGAVSRSPASDGSILVTQEGRTSIADSVVRKIAGIATREIAGVHSLGTSGTRAFGAMRQRIPGSSGPNVAQGVSVEVGEQQAAIDLDVVVEYGVSIPTLANAIRGNVMSSIQRMTGLEVVEVNLSVDDVHLHGDGEDSEQPSRVQ